MLRQQIIDKVEASFKVAESYYGRTFTRPNHIIFKNIRCIGYCNYVKSVLMFNLELGSQNPSHLVDVTAPHEVAHWIDRELHGYEKNGKKWVHHGYTWKNIMVKVFNLPPHVTAQRSDGFDYSKVRTRKVREVKRFKYTCRCGKMFNITSILHNKILKGSPRWCLSCRTNIFPYVPTKTEQISDTQKIIQNIQQQLAQLQNT